MSPSIRALAAVCAFSCLPALAQAQTCLGFPAFLTGPVNISASGTVGGRFWGAGGSINAGRRTGGPFVSAGVGSTSYIDEPTETRFEYSVLAGFERHNKDQLIWCPIVSATTARGNEVDLGNGLRSETNGTIYGAGLGISGELPGRGRFSVDPMITARYVWLTSTVTGDSTSSIKEQGINFAVGLGIRLRDAIQITPIAAGSTLPNGDFIFTLRFSLALEFRKQ